MPLLYKNRLVLPIQFNQTSNASYSYILAPIHFRRIFETASKERLPHPQLISLFQMRFAMEYHAHTERHVQYMREKPSARVSSRVRRHSNTSAARI